jgi:primase-polymerase (primpol)-like protein
MSAFEDMPAIAQMAERGARWVCWRNETRNHRQTKVPLRTNGQLADSTRAATWNSFDECLKAQPKVKADGLGFVLAAERDAEAGQQPIVGIDLDGCRDPATGVIESWASATITELASYAEVSPSGTGVKVYCSVDPVPRLKAHKLVIKPTNGTGKAQQIEVFTTARYFAVTGQHLDGTPDEICDATAAFEHLVARMEREAKKRGGNGTTAGSSATGARPMPPCGCWP